MLLILSYICTFSPGIPYTLHSSRLPKQLNVRSSWSSSSNNDVAQSGVGVNKGDNQDKSYTRRSNSWIVILDDEEPIRLAVGDYLYDSGYSVTACADAEAVLELLSSIQNDDQNYSDDGEGFTRKKFPDAIIIDIRMPGQRMNGLDLLRKLKNPGNNIQAKWKQIPAIVLSAKGLTQDRIYGYKLGADAYLSKPVNPDELLSVIDNLIRRRKEQSNNAEFGKREQLMALKRDIGNIKEILQANRGGAVRRALPPSTQKLLGSTDPLAEYNDDDLLTTPERQVLELLSQGFTNLEIANVRGNTNAAAVSGIISRLYRKSRTKTRTELLRWAIEMEYVTSK